MHSACAMHRACTMWLEYLRYRVRVGATLMHIECLPNGVRALSILIQAYIIFAHFFMGGGGAKVLITNIQFRCIDS